MKPTGTFKTLATVFFVSLITWPGISPDLIGAEKGAESQKQRATLPAFPGARGAGSTTQAGRRGKVYKVVRLDDYGKNEEPIPGTLRNALEQKGPRVVVFGVGGTLHLERPLVVGNPYLTVAGNTAPFPGITITGYPTMVRADHVVLRYLRFRLDIDVMRQRFKNGQDSGWDSVNAARCEYVVFDHLSASHSVDETISFSGEVDHVTLSHSIAAYSLRSVFHDYYFSRGPDYKHTKHHNLGGLIAYLGKHDRHATASSIYNVWAHHNRRMPGLSAGRNDPENLMSYIDIRNSVMYNWKSNAAGIETGDLERSRYHVNLVGNYFKPGPNTPRNRRYAGLKVMGYNKVYLKDNIHHEDAKKKRETRQKKLLLDRGRLPAGQKRLLDEPLPTPPASTLDSPTLKDLANGTVGCSIPCRDSVDALVIQNIFNGTGRHPFVDMKRNDSPPVPELPATHHVYASPEDPFPVWWKLNQGIEPDHIIDPLADSDGNGYTNIESYLYGLSLKGKAVDWTQAEHNRNPLENPALYDWSSGTDATGDGWANREKNETIFNSAGGLLLIASATIKNTEKSHGCGELLRNDANFWTPGSPARQHIGPDGARTDKGPAIVLAFPLPRKLAGVQIAKPEADAYPAAHDPTRVTVQGLRGWPAHWANLLESKNTRVLSDKNPTQKIVIPEKNRAFFAAYRIILSKTHGNQDVRIQSVEPMHQTNYER
ncbi:MAG: hypothetical protein KGZ25_04045 [Planctomycetes bacterium]|nr:hypothetical protein [Planctomycetota bacterium]